MINSTGELVDFKSVETEFYRNVIGKGTVKLNAIGGLDVDVWNYRVSTGMGKM